MNAADAVTTTLDVIMNDDAPDMSVAAMSAAVVSAAMHSLTPSTMTESDGMRALLRVLSDAAHDAITANVCDESGEKQLIAFAHGLDLALSAIRR